MSENAGDGPAEPQGQDDAPLEHGHFCPHCGKPTAEEDAFCRVCGTDLRVGTSGAAASDGETQPDEESREAEVEQPAAPDPAPVAGGPRRRRWPLVVLIVGLMAAGVVAVLAIGGVFSSSGDDQDALGEERARLRPQLTVIMRERDAFFVQQRRYIQAMGDANTTLNAWRREDRETTAESKRINEEFADEFDACARFVDVPCPSPEYPDPVKVPSVSAEARRLRRVDARLQEASARLSSTTPQPELRVLHAQLLASIAALRDEAAHNADVLDEAVTPAQGDDPGRVERGKLKTLRRLTALPSIRQMNRAAVALIDGLRLPRSQFDVPGGRDLDDGDSSDEQ